MINSLSVFEERLLNNRVTNRLVLAAGEDLYALKAIVDAKKKGYIDPVIVGNKDTISKLSQTHEILLDGVELIDEIDQYSAVEKAVKLVSSGQAEILMKGATSTSVLLRAVLNKEWGLLKGDLLSHISLFQIPRYHKLLALTDVAINIAPDLQAKISILENAVEFLNCVGIKKPKVAIIAAVEKAYDSMPATIDATEIVKLAQLGRFHECIVDGPFALDNAINRESAEHKGIDSTVAGDADLLLMPQIESGNVLYKALSFLMETKSAAVVLGAAAPIVLTSRSDSHESKLNSIMLASLSTLK